MGEVKNWIGDVFRDGPDVGPPEDQVSMKPLLLKVIEEAFRIAVVDSLLPEATDERRVKIYRDIYAITEEEWGSIDPSALAKNLCNRLLGSGGWAVRGVYSGNASAKDVFDATMLNQDENQTDNFVSDLREWMEEEPND